MCDGTELKTLEGHSDKIYSVTFSADSKILASGSGDHSIKLWDVQKQCEIQTLKGHSDIVASVAFSPDLRNFASGSHDKTIKFWRINFEKILAGEKH